ncbi:MAG: hypothetical protein LC793_16125 [Thermomicrobia bacterium]|nr:hypothetical protein [Thermomicrobia bacterium]
MRCPSSPFVGVRPLGFALIGVLLERAGGTTTVLIIAGWLALVALVTTFNRHVREAPALNALPLQ